MRQMPTMTSYMHPFPWAVDVERSPSEALAEMDKHGIHHLPVKSGNEVIGLVSALQLQHTLAEHTATTDLSEYCNAETPQFQTRDALDIVLTHMIDHNQHAALIMKADKLAGIYTSHDAIIHLCKLLNELYPQGDDAA
ncbi:MAG: hypothetical protein DRQ60_05280 [Gammaproteobacteria bacterium]|nr:MAG: hypothetical protein DRQ52_04895 [Gammaproteobacteria bacterium]RLA16073.1 MAG: hypothetical protein DRQ60_05280 [Gammaproteobacteria bacterium]